MRITIVATLLLVLGACSNERDLSVDNELFATEAAGDALTPGSRPVMIGEAGPRFAACGGFGRVVGRADGGPLTIHEAPFAEAASTGEVVDGARLHVCARTLDQRWLGVVVPVEGGDCGVAAPVDAPRAYEGPCASGWVSSAFVRLVAQ